MKKNYIVVRGSGSFNDSFTLCNFNNCSRLMIKIETQNRDLGLRIILKEKR